MNAHRDAVASDDLSALAWVHDELRRSLEAAHKSLRRFLRETESTYDSDVDTVDPAVLRSARQQLHQGVGALELVGLPAAAALLRASESAVQRFAGKAHKIDLDTVEMIEQASFALLDYLGRRLVNKPIPSLALFPQYRAVQTMAGADRVHPADLWEFDWRWLDMPAEPGVEGRPCDAAARAELESQLLSAMRGDAAASAALSELAASLAAGTASGELHERNLWQLAAAFFEAQSLGLLKPDIYSKRVASRLLAQARILERHDHDVSERLTQDLLFFCAQSAAPAPGRSAPRLEAVRRHYGLQHAEPFDYEVARLGRVDPAAIVQARKRVSAAKDAWSAVAGGEMHRLSGLAEQFALVCDSLQRVHEGGERLAAALHEAVEHTVQSNASPSPALAMEVATAMLYVEASLEDAEFDSPEQAGRAERLAERIEQTRLGQRAGPLEPWMEDLYRRVSDRQTMGSVVQELRASLLESEKLIDQFHRKPADRSVLIPVPSQLATMRGVLSVLGMDQASQAVLRMRDEIDSWIASPDFDPAHPSSSGRFERLAGNIGALGFLIDMLSVQPHLAKSLFVYDAAAGTLSPLTGRRAASPGHAPAPAATTVEPRLIEQAMSLAASASSDEVPLAQVTLGLERISHEALAADQPSLAETVTQAQRSLQAATGRDDVATARDRVAEALTGFVITASGPAGLEPLPAAPAAAVPAAAQAAGFDGDDEMLGVFLEEAREVIGGAGEALVALAAENDNIEQLTTVRRAFHTLKGSSRMVGLTDFGEAAWACEQLYNARLAEAPRADPPLLECTTQVLDYLRDWADAITARRNGGHDAAAVRAVADAMRNGRVPAPLPLPLQPSAPSRVETERAAREPEVEPVSLVFDDPLSAADARPDEKAVVAAAQRSPAAGVALAAPGFQIDLRLLDESAAAKPAPTVRPPAIADAEPAVEGFFEATRPLPSLHESIDVPSPTPVEAIDLDLCTDPGALDALARAGAATPAATAPAKAIDATAPFDAIDAVPAAEVIEAAMPFEPGEAAVPFDTSAAAIAADFGGGAVPPDVVDMAGMPAVSEAAMPVGIGETVVPSDEPGAAAAAERVEAAWAPSGAISAEPLAGPVDAPAWAQPIGDMPAAESATPAEPAHAFDAPPPAGPWAAFGGPELGADTVAPAPAEAAVSAEMPLAIELPADAAAAAFADELAAEPAEAPLAIELPAEAAAAAFADELAAESAEAPLAIELPTEGEAPVAADQPSSEPAETTPPIELPTEATAAVAADRPAAEPVAAEPAAAASEADGVKVVGPLRISVPLFNIYLNEADELSRRLTTEIAEWAMELHRPVGETPIALAHSLAGSSATVGFADLSHLARALEHALTRSHAIGNGTADEARLFVDAAEEIRRLLHQFAAGFLMPVSGSLFERLAAHEVESARRLEALAAAPEPEVADDVGTGGFGRPAVSSVAGDTAAMETGRQVPALGRIELTSFAGLPDETAAAVPASLDAPDDVDGIDAIDAVDPDLFPIFEEEGQELLPQLASRMRDWQRRPSDAAGASGCMRTLHTLKGGARLAGAMRLGELAHRLETAIEHLLARGDATTDDVEALQSRVDGIAASFEALRQRDAAAYAQAAPRIGGAPGADAAVLPPTGNGAAGVAAIDAAPAVLDASPAGAAPDAETQRAAAGHDAGGALPQGDEAAADRLPAPAAEPAAGRQAPDRTDLESRKRSPVDDGIDWSRFASDRDAESRNEPAPAPVPTLPERRSAARGGGANAGAVRVRAPLLDRLVNHAGEVSITRSRIETDVAQLRTSLNDLTENLDRLRRQLRDLELQAETQISSRMEAARAASEAFDPLELDRFTRFQELTRMMAESVNDVATVQRTLARTLQSTEDELAAQARLTRDLQDDLLRTRMVEFEGLSDRLYRVVRQAAKETGKQVRLDIVGGSIEVDRGVLDRMTGSFEHLLRNCVTHGIEAPEVRTAAGKDPTGLIFVAVGHEGNEVSVEFRDDGAGLNLPKIRERGVARGLLEPGAEPSDAELANLIFVPGMSTADNVTELAGRGVGMDVVRADVNAMGGRIETATATGKGTSFRLVLPLTTAVTQVVMVRCGDTTVAIPSTLVEIVRRAKPEEVEQSYASGIYLAGERALPFFWLGALLQSSARGTEVARTLPVIVIRSAQQRVALHVDEVLGNHEVVVKNLGPQLSKLPGLAGMTLLASGTVALIYNPVALATVYGDAARAMTRAALTAPQVDEVAPVQATAPTANAAPLVMVVDDSLTVRRVTQRLLAREGYRVCVAKDGLEALERLAEERPAVLLSDIEMPRMDGFDLVRNVRGDGRWRDLPVIMITSRIAQKHRDVAAELGVEHYLGKPYAEEDLLALVARYTASVAAA